MGFISLDKEIKDEGVIYFDALILQETLHRKKNGLSTPQQTARLYYK